MDRGTTETANRPRAETTHSDSSGRFLSALALSEKAKRLARAGSVPTRWISGFSQSSDGVLVLGVPIRSSQESFLVGTEQMHFLRSEVKADRVAMAKSMETGDAHRDSISGRSESVEVGNVSQAFNHLDLKHSFALILFGYLDMLRPDAKRKLTSWSKRNAGRRLRRKLASAKIG